MSERAAAALFLAIAMTLPLSALVARGVPRGWALRLALVWVAIFLVAALVAGTLESPSNAHVLHNIYYQTG